MVEKRYPDGVNGKAIGELEVQMYAAQGVRLRRREKRLAEEEFALRERLGECRNRMGTIALYKQDREEVASSLADLHANVEAEEASDRNREERLSAELAKVGGLEALTGKIAALESSLADLEGRRSQQGAAEIATPDDRQLEIIGDIAKLSARLVPLRAQFDTIESLKTPPPKDARAALVRLAPMLKQELRWIDGAVHMRPGAEAALTAEVQEIEARLAQITEEDAARSDADNAEHHARGRARAAGVSV